MTVRRLTREEIEYAVRRNFDGFTKDNIDPEDIFRRHIKRYGEVTSQKLPPEPNTPIGILYYSIFSGSLIPVYLYRAQILMFI